MNRLLWDLHLTHLLSHQRHSFFYTSFCQLNGYRQVAEFYAEEIVPCSPTVKFIEANQATSSLIIFFLLLVNNGRIQLQVSHILV
jgi:hypothetical protein